MTHQERTRLAAGNLLLVVAGLAWVMVLLVTCQQAPQHWETPPVAGTEPSLEQEGKDGDPSGLGDDVSAAPVTEARKENIRLYEPAGFTVEVPKVPLAGQRRPPCKLQLEVEIRGGCWFAGVRSKAPCMDGYYEWKGFCYIPIFHYQRDPSAGS